jgi:lysozyme family protein
MSNAFDKAIDHAMLYEVGGFWKLTPEVEAGLISTKEQRKAVGYVNDPTDRGGETKFGVAKNANQDLDIAKLTWAQAKEVYYKRYWLAAKCDQLPGRYAALHFDIAVNHGVKRAAIFLQRALNVDDDGAIGSITLGKANTADEFDLCTAVCDQRKKYYEDIIQNNPSQEKYRKGWMRRCDELREFVLNPNNQF